LDGKGYSLYLKTEIHGWLIFGITINAI